MDDFERGKRLGRHWLTPIILAGWILMFLYFSGFFG